jgi:hypothetical protein
VNAQRYSTSTVWIERKSNAVLNEILDQIEDATGLDVIVENVVSHRWYLLSFEKENAGKTVFNQSDFE